MPRVTRAFMVVIADDVPLPIDIDAGGTLTFDGSATVRRARNATSSEGVALDGSASVTRARNASASDSIVFDGAAFPALASFLPIDASGTITFGGSAELGHYVEPPAIDAYVDRLLEQFKRKPRWTALLKAYLRGVEELRSEIHRTELETRLANADGAQLDVWGRKFGQARLGYEDADYRRLLQARLAAKFSRGTVPDLLRVARAFVPEDATITAPTSARGVVTIEVTTASGADFRWELLLDLLKDAALGGVRVHLVYSPFAEGGVFAFADGPARQADAARGFSDVAQTVGGRLAGVIS